MAHLVQIPPPAAFHVPSMTTFSVSAPNGVGFIGAWGLAGSPWSHWRVGTDFEPEVVSYIEMHPSLGADLWKCELRGVKKDQKLAVFRWDTTTNAWGRYSPYVTVTENTANTFQGVPLPKCVHNTKISYYPFGATQACPPMPEPTWKTAIEAAMNQLFANPIGKYVIQSFTTDIVISPYLPCGKNAWSSVLINPSQWNSFEPGARADEILLHELIHRVENRTQDYEDRYGFAFDKSDFLTINATNVYSCMLGRALRKDHHGFESLPTEHFNSPRTHFDQQKPNYKLSKQHASGLINTLMPIKNVWNPFQYL